MGISGFSTVFLGEDCGFTLRSLLRCCSFVGEGVVPFLCCFVHLGQLVEGLGIWKMLLRSQEMRLLVRDMVRMAGGVVERLAGRMDGEGGWGGR